ncbi:WAT1-related protein At3g28050-like isoform X1 [Nicotiana tomentosiformis]|uniref:WAT1-related protein At3g28050-like isoform X1 n=1 Tax=Nicotiana tomentosiformis TaxID=4098 RepID=UPI00051BBE89|nr:WAT1-related protein At3g28050-like isoform X1 [Nicotiana tomentosiformis]XP_009594125.1 WAT1-related protein At3g28050-like isoform X1 [Nicotiana tomentosiformis]
MWSSGLLIIALLLTVECMEVGLNTLNKAATTRGMSNFVFIFYSNALALFFLLPSTFIYHSRIKPCRKLYFSMFCRMFLLALLSCSVQILLYFGIEYSNPTLASAMTDLVPAFTFLIALIAGMEKLGLKVKSSMAKFIGTITLLIGALLMTFYRGPPIFSNKSKFSKSFHQLLITTKSNWIIGGFLLGAANFLLALLYIVQAWIINDFPEEFMVTTVTCGLVTIMSAVVGLFAERNPSSWRLKPDLELITICYAAILMVFLRSLIYVWALKKKGPVFVVMVKPLGMVAAVILGVTFLGDVLHVGNVIGGTIIAFGFYSVMWGKAKEEICVEDIGMDSGSATTTVPLLSRQSDSA